MTPPTAERLFATLDATWPAARVFDDGPWRFREGLGGGQRVSATTAIAAIDEHDVQSAEEQMRALGQTGLFMLRDGEEALDDILSSRRYDIVDPVTLYLAETDALTKPLSITDAMPSWPPLAIQIELWRDGGIGPARIAVMERAGQPKTTFVGRAGDAPVGTVFAAAYGDIVMVHALEVDKRARRRGVGRRLMQATANWASRHGAAWVTLAVTRANESANALYRNLGMTEVARYHYRRAPEAIG